LSAPPYTLHFTHLDSTGTVGLYDGMSVTRSKASVGVTIKTPFICALAMVATAEVQRGSNGKKRHIIQVTWALLGKKNTA